MTITKIGSSQRTATTVMSTLRPQGGDGQNTSHARILDDGEDDDGSDDGQEQDGGHGTFNSADCRVADVIWHEITNPSTRTHQGLDVRRWINGYNCFR